MSSIYDSDQLCSIEDSSRVDNLCDEYEQLLVNGEQPILEDFLALAEARLRSVLLRQLLLLQWEYDRRRSQTIRFASYLRRFPEYSDVLAETLQEALSEPQADSDSTNSKENATGRCSTILESESARYEITRQISAGAMATVLVGRDLTNDRDVVIKVFRLNPRFSMRAFERFCAEIDSLDRLQHPNIVRVYDVQVQGDSKFYVMEYCRGGSLADELGKSVLVARDAASLVETLARAVQSAHDEKIVHRDLKPENVVLQRKEICDKSAPRKPTTCSRIMDRFIPKVADFGLVKDLGATSLTRTHELLGSLPYMAPEQLEDSKKVGPAADIHALGVILYECLTGRTPYLDKTPALTIQRIVSSPAPSIRATQPAVPIDLESICRLCLEKNPSDRYSSAFELAQDLRRFLDRKQTFAQPLGLAPATYRWMLRNPLRSTIYFLAFMLSVGLAWHSYSLDKLNQGMRILAEEARVSQKRAERLHYASEISNAGKSYHEGDLQTVRNILADLEETVPDSTIRGFEWEFLRQAIEPPDLTLRKFGTSLYCIELSPDGRLLAVAGEEGTIWLIDRETQSLTRTIVTQQIEVNSVAFLEDGLRIASAGDDGSVCVWRITDGQLLKRIEKAHSGIAYGVKTQIGDDILSCGGDGFVRHWQGSEIKSEYKNHDGRVEAIAVSPDNRWFASVGKDTKLIVRELSNGKVKLEVDEEGYSHFSCVAFSNDSNMVAVGQSSGSKDAAIYDLDTGENLWSASQPDGLSSVSFSEDDQQVLTTDQKGLARVFHLRVSGQATDGSSDPWICIPVDESRAHSAIFMPEENAFLAVGQDGRLVRCELQTTSRSFDRAVWSLDFFSDGFLALAMGRNGVALIDPNLANVKTIDSPDTSWRFVASAVDGSAVFLGGMSTVDELCPKIARLDINKEELITVYVGQAHIRINDLSCSPDGKMLAFLCEEPFKNGKKQVVLLELASGRVIEQLPASSRTQPRFSPDSSRLFFGSQRDIHVFEIETHHHTVMSEAHRDSQICLDVSSDNKWLATSDEREIKIWDLSTNQEHAALQGHSSSINTLSFSPDSKTLISGSDDGTVKAWSVLIGKYLLDLHRAPDNCAVIDAVFSKDWQRLAVVEGSSKVWIHDTVRH